jgi:hypothetical protein
VSAPRILRDCRFRETHGYPCDPLHPVLEQLCAPCAKAYAPLTPKERRRVFLWLQKVWRPGAQLS